MDRERNTRRPASTGERPHTRPRTDERGRDARRPQGDSRRQNPASGPRQPARASNGRPASGRREQPGGSGARKPRSTQPTPAELHRRKQQKRREKQQAKAARAEKRRAEARRRPVRPLERRGLRIKLGVTLGVVVMLLLCMAIFFKVEHISVSGNVRYTAQEIGDASEVDTGANLLTLSKSGIAGRIHSALPYVGDIQVGIKLPNTVMIDITEREAAFAAKDNRGTWWLLSPDGVVLEQSEAQPTGTHILLQGLTLQSAAPGLVFSPQPVAGEEESHTGTATERGTAALEIMAVLGKDDRSGKITAVDVSNINDLRVYYGTDFEVLLSDMSRLTYKTRYMVQAVEQLMAEGYRGGVLDLSFREEERAVFTPW